MWLGGLIHEINRLSHLKVDAPRICGFSLSSSGRMDEIREIRLWGQPAGRFLLPSLLIVEHQEGGFSAASFLDRAPFRVRYSGFKSKYF